MTTRPRSLRETMPLVTAFIDDLREIFGKDDINATIKAGMAGVPGFWARENGNEVGTRYHERGTEISAAQMVIIPPEKKEPSHADRNPRHR